MGLVPWSPLAGGFLTGKYGPDDKREEGNRLNGGNPFGGSKFNERNWRILDTLKQVADEAGSPLASVALAWAMEQPGVDALLLGASKPQQVTSNVAALDLYLTEEARSKLDAASALDAAFPYSGFTAGIKRSMFGDRDVRNWRG